MTDQELREMLANLLQAQTKTDAQLSETDAQLAKTDAQRARTDAQLAKTDAKLDRLAELHAKTDAQLAKTDAQLAKTDAQLAKTDAKLDRLAEMYGGVGNNQGKVAEEYFYNSLKPNPTLNGIQFEFIEKNVTRSAFGIEEEYDLLLVNGEDVFIIEVKYYLHPKDIRKLLERKLPNFRKLYPKYRDHRVHLGLATFAVEDEVRDLALEQGVTVLQRCGEVIETLAAAA